MTKEKGGPVIFFDGIVEGLKYSVIKLSVHGKLLVRVSDIQQFKVLRRLAYYSTWNFWIKKPTGPSPEISVHPGVTLSCILSLLFVFFCEIFFDRKP